MSRGHAFALLLAIGGTASAAESIPVPVGGTLNFELPGNRLTNEFYVDVPGGTQRLKLRLLATNANQDLDLMVKFGTPFPDTTIDGLPPDPNWLYEQSHYAGISATGDETITLTSAGHQPLRAGRLHISILNYDPASAQVALSAEAQSADSFESFQVLFDDPGVTGDPCNTTPWNDATPATPIRGNSGTTLGAQRRNALLEAARLLATELKPKARVTIRACWDTLASSNTLAQAGPEDIVLSETGYSSSSRLLSAYNRFLEKPFTFYSQAAAAHMAGTPSCSLIGLGGPCNQADLQITYNTTIDQNANPNRRFDYGFDAQGTVGPSFITVSMHEIAHGLGFIGLIQTDPERGQVGSKFFEYDDIYGSWARIGPPFPPRREFLRATTEERATALTTTDMLRFAGPEGITSSFNQFRAFTPPTQYIPLHTPNPTAPGSTYSHVSTTSGGQLMTAQISGDFRSLDLAGGMLRDLGWVGGDKAPPANILPPDAQFYDITRSGHGFDMRRIDGTEDLYYLLFYTFDASGNPEWFNAIGRVQDGLFMPERNPAGDSLANNLFRPGQTPQTVIDSSPTFNGHIRVDYRGAEAAPVCQQPAPGRPSDESLGRMNWVLDTTVEEWCVQPITVDNSAVQTDISGIWFDPADTGWGITFVSFPGASGDGLAAQIYYPDASGAGRWALMFADTHVPGSTYPVFHPRNGYCRTCPATEVLFDQQIGTIKVDIGGAGAPKVSLDLTYPGAQGGRFMRTDSPVVTASARRF